MAKEPVAPRILVVDDGPMVYLRITRALRDEGYEVTAVANGRAALEAAQTAQPAFNLVVTNTWMGGLSDAELISRLRVDFPTVPILHVDDFARHKSSAELRQDVTALYKPFSITALRKAVADLLVGSGQFRDAGQGVARQAPPGSALSPDGESSVGGPGSAGKLGVSRGVATFEQRTDGPLLLRLRLSGGRPR